MVRKFLAVNIYLAEAFNKTPMVAWLTDNEEWLYLVMASFQANAELRFLEMMKQIVELQLLQEEMNHEYWHTFSFPNKGKQLVCLGEEYLAWLQ